MTYEPYSVQELLETMFDCRDLTLGDVHNLLRRAVDQPAKRALQLGRDTGTPVYVLEHGKIVDLTKRHRRKTRRQ